jgi:hypothetical protein
LKDWAKALENFCAQFREFGASVVNDRLGHGSQDSVGDIRGTRDLKKVAARMNHRNSGTIG